MSIIELRVHMDCAGCETKIKKALQKIQGVDDIDIDMRMQKVTIMGWADRKKVLKAVRKTGRRAELWTYPYNPQYDQYNNNYQEHQPHHQRSETSIAYHAISQQQPQYSSSSYNYKHHGYGGNDHGYYQQPPYSTIFDDRTTTMFSDENAHACSIM